MAFSSKDFYKISSSLNVVNQSKLIHKNVLHGDSEAEHEFSRDRKHLVRIVDLPTKTMSMTIGGLEPGQSTNKHRHNYESIIYIIKGSGFSIIDDETIEWEAGDAIYIPPWAWHQHANSSQTHSCLYVACENAPLLQNLGNIALREET